MKKITLITLILVGAWHEKFEKLILLKLAGKVSSHLNILSIMKKKMQNCLSFRSNSRILCLCYLLQGCERTFHKKRENLSKTRKRMWNWGKKAKYGLKIKEKAEIVAHRKFWKKKKKSAEKRNSHTPVIVLNYLVWWPHFLSNFQATFLLIFPKVFWIFTPNFTTKSEKYT